MLPSIKRLGAAPAGRRTKWLVLGLWVLLLAVMGPLAGKTGDVEDNGPNAFLPGASESAQVNDQLHRFRSDDKLPAVIVYVRAGGVTAADQAKAEADRAAFGQYTYGTPVPPPLKSEGGDALLLTVPLSYEDDDITGTVGDLRKAAAADAPPGLDVKVAGPAGELTDAISVFNTLDGTLMLASGMVVAVLLLLTYRSPTLWLLPLISVVFSVVLSQGAVYLAAKHAGVPVDGQSGGILAVLVFGVGTDYALLLIARYREELHRHADRHTAMKVAMRRSGPAILASAGTVVLGLLCLTFADLNSNRSLGAVGAIGVVCGFLAMVTVLPALLVIFGRWVFWPLIPRANTPVPQRRSLWPAVARTLDRYPRRSWTLGVAACLLLAVAALGVNIGLTNEDIYKDTPESISGQRLIAAHYPAGSSAPADVIAPASSAAAVENLVRNTPGIAGLEPATPSTDGTLVRIGAVLGDAPDGPAARATVERLRTALDGQAQVGGPTAGTVDVTAATARDRNLIMPLALVVVFIVLALLLRSIVAPLMLLGTVVVSYFAALGGANLLFEHAFGFNGVDYGLPLLGFVFLVSLGVDYNIFLMHRVREETARLGHRRGVLTALTGTGSVITSAGLVLAATFMVMGTLPLTPLVELGVLVAFGVLLDTFLVRSIIVPALALDLGEKLWWPAKPHPAKPTEHRILTTV